MEEEDRTVYRGWRQSIVVIVKQLNPMTDFALDIVGLLAEHDTVTELFWLRTNAAHLPSSDDRPKQ
jgi:hypothetical protein